MARQATSGQPRNVIETTGDYEINEDDDYIAIGVGWTGGTITLPGPGSDHPNPNDGDQYTIADPQGLVTGGHTLTINGGGFDFWSGALVASATYGVFTFELGEGGPYTTALKFTFDAISKIWIVEA